jgi:hypothetical protein
VVTCLGHDIHGGAILRGRDSSNMQVKNNSSTGGAAAGKARAPNESVAHVLGRCETPDQFCAALAKLFGVRATEVALLRLQRGLLSFLHPEALKTAGTIPASGSGAVAARTASTKKAELFNSFVKVKHASIFENVKLASPEEDPQGEQGTIQKLMSAPVLDAQNKVLGVVQVCRKGHDVNNSGPDFSADDLQQLELAAKALCNLAFIK